MKSLQGKMAQPRKDTTGPVMSIKLGGAKKDAGPGGASAAGGGGFKKGGFKNAFAPVGGDYEEEEKSGGDKKDGKEDMQMEGVDSDVTDEEDYYDPSRPTGCMPGCPGRASQRNG